MPRPKEFDTEEVLQKAMDLFWEQGYEATTAQDLVDHLGIGRSSLYGTFGSKHELYLRALDHYRRMGSKQTDQLLQDADSPMAAIRRLFDHTAQASAQDPRGCFLANATAERAGDNADVNAVACDNLDQLRTMLADLVRRAQADGDMPEHLDPQAVAHLLAVVQYGLRVTARTEPDEETVAEAVDVLLSVLQSDTAQNGDASQKTKEAESS